MDGNPEGTPNPLNPASGTASAASQPQPNAGTAAGTGNTAAFEPVKPASFAQDAERTGQVTGSAMPEMNTAEPVSAMPNIPQARPAARVNNSVVDPMMRPVSHAPRATAPAQSEANFDTLEMDNVSLDELSSGLGAQPSGPELVAKDSVVEPAGHKGGKKKGLIIGAIVLIMIAVICGAAAIAIALLNNGDDKVTRAIDKLINGQMPSIVAAQGNINIAYDSDDDGSSSFSISANSASIDFDGTFDTASSMSKVSASVNAEFTNGGEATIDIDELSTKDGDVFFKIGGVSSILRAMYPPITLDTAEEAETVETNCLGDSDMNCGDAEDEDTADLTDLTMTGGLLSIYSGMFDAIDDQWILASGDFEESMEGLELFDNSSTCLIDALGTLPNYASDIASKYKANPFIAYSTDKLEITKRKNSLYRLSFDDDKLAAFANSLLNSGFVNELNACAGNTASNSGISVEDVKNALAGFPTLYAEIDDNDNFTRVYFKNSTMTADINLSYPSELKITEPEDYIDISTMLSNVLTALFTTNDSMVVEGTVEEQE